MVKLERERGDHNWIILIYKNRNFINKKNIATGFILGILSISSGLITTFSISNIIAMSLIFGLPFTLLQMKRDLLTAIGSHALVDLIRFSLFGI